MTAPRCTAPIRPSGPRHRLPPTWRVPGAALLAAAATTPTVLRSRHLIAGPARVLNATPMWVVALAGLGFGVLLMLVAVLLFDLTEPVPAPVPHPVLPPVDPRS